jgi:NAD(P)-dependent dehydrogenase (short-subunit alcohol dehydrogenase family)
MSADFKDKTVIITGGGTGIGKATALAFARAGANVVIACVRPQVGEEAVDEIKRSGGEAAFVQCDVARPEQVEEMVDAAVRLYGGLDLAFNNAGIEGQTAATADYPIEMWRKVIDVNLIGVWLCMKYEIEAMLRSGHGSIVNNSSILGTVGFANASAYVASKHGILGLTKTAAIEYAAQNIRVNAVCPGFIETPMLDRAGITSNLQMREAIANLHPVHRLGKPEEVAAAVLWLCSDAASFVTGHAMLVDGGYSAQ